MPYFVWRTLCTQKHTQTNKTDLTISSYNHIVYAYDILANKYIDTPWLREITILAYRLLNFQRCEIEESKMIIRTLHSILHQKLVAITAKTSAHDQLTVIGIFDALLARMHACVHINYLICDAYILHAVMLYVVIIIGVCK